MTEKVRIVAKRIHDLEVQGARNIAIAGLEAMKNLAGETIAASREEFLQELHEAQIQLSSSRATEPLMRNALRLIISRIQENKSENIDVLKRIVISCTKEFLQELEGSKRCIAEIGARRIRNNSVVFTHCHSSTVTNLLSQAKKDGKEFEVVCTETRPFFQGRVTASEMVSLGLKTTLIVDSAARFFMKDADIVVVGADAITSEGNVVNKIGTSAIALLASEARKPFYVVSELLKFDPVTICGDYEKIEERDPKEVWDDPPEKLVVRNPAFDVTRRDFIHGIICEEGIISPHSVAELIHRKHPWVFEP